jgi:predicted kinase
MAELLILTGPPGAGKSTVELQAPMPKTITMAEVRESTVHR